MNKKVTRIFITLCLMLVMTSSTVMAASTKTVGISTTVPANSKPSKTASFNYAILEKKDRITKDDQGQKCNARVTGHVLITYDTTGKAKLTVTDVTFQGVNANASEYSYEITRFENSDRNISLHIYRNGWKIGHLHIYMNDDRFKIDHFNDRD